MSARQLIVLVVAAIAAVGALLIIRSMGKSEPQQVEVAAPIDGQQVLIAARDIPQGAAISPSDIGVAAFPEEAISDAFVRIANQPSAQSDFVGAVTRRAFVRGEPIVASSVVQAEGRGFMAAMLQPGFRAVSVEIDPATAAGGYIQPNDHVDVIATMRNEGGDGEGYRSVIVLQDIRVIALGEETQPQEGGDGPRVINAGVAVLEMSAEDARVLAQADALGQIHLVLRGVEAETAGMARSSASSLSQQSSSVRVHAFGRVSGGGS